MTESHEERVNRLTDEHRKLLQATVQESWRSYDKTSLTLSGGALGISFAFVKDVVGKAPVTQSWILSVGWGALALSMGLVLLSFFAAGKANERALDEFDAGKPQTGGRWGGITGWCNGAGGILLVVGVLLVLTFVVINLK